MKSKVVDSENYCIVCIEKTIESRFVTLSFLTRKPPVNDLKQKC